MATKQDLINHALAEVGYLEKKTNSQLDSKTANAGYNNYTKYARDLDNITGFYNYKKNGYAWCDIFVDWNFVKVFGVEKAKELLGQPSYSLGAACGYSANYFKAMNRFYKSNPKPGDVIFFLDSVGDVAHTGIVYKVDSSYVYTVEGNTSGTAGVVPNGGGVFKKSYSLTYNRIYGYGRPAYEDEGEPEDTSKPMLRRGDTGADVVYLQKRLILHGHNLAPYGADGDFGATTEKEVKAFQKNHGLEVDGIVGPATWTELDKEPKEEKERPTLRRGDKGEEVVYLQKRLMAIGYSLSPYGADGDFGSTTEKRVKEFQKREQLEVDGIVGPATWEALDNAQAAYTIMVTANGGLNIRKGSGTNYSVIGTLGKGQKKTIIEEENGWGKLSDMNGWISLTYTKKV